MNYFDKYLRIQLIECIIMVQHVVETVSNPNIREVEECKEKGKIPDKKLIENMLSSAVRKDYEFTLENLNIEESTPGSTSGIIIAEGEGNCVIYDKSEMKLNFFEYDIHHFFTSDPSYEKLEVVIHLTQD